jgi:soluble lytic murein transglycosylase-like protein
MFRIKLTMMSEGTVTTVNVAQITRFEQLPRQHGLPPEVADAVMRVESGYDPNAVGRVGERELMQVLPSTATMLGFRGTMEELADPATNIRLGHN